MWFDVPSYGSTLWKFWNCFPTGFSLIGSRIGCGLMFRIMDQHSGNLEYSDSEFSSPRNVVSYSDTDSLGESVGSVAISQAEVGSDAIFQTEAANFVGSSDAESLGESVGSVEIGRTRKEEPKPNCGVAIFRRPRKVKKPGPQFMQFSIELRDVPVERAWEFIRSDRNVSDLFPGVVGDFDYLEGDGSTGSVFLILFTRGYTKRGEKTYGMHKVEMRDDLSHMNVVRCVGGRTLNRYLIYLSLMKVVPDEVLGDSSSVFIWRLEYQLSNPQIPIAKQTKMVYMSTMDLIRNRIVSLNRVDRPPDSPKMAKRLRLQVRADQQENPRQGRKSRVQFQLKEKGIAPDGQNKDRPRRKARIELLGKEDKEDN